MTLTSRTALLLTVCLVGPLAAQDEPKPAPPPATPSIEIPDVVQGITA